MRLVAKEKNANYNAKDAIYNQMKNKISFTFTTYNEAKNVSLLLESILKQSVRPDEIVVVDAGSTDNTVAAIKKIPAGKTKLKVIVEKGATIGRGRNIAIQNASGNLIFSADASTQFEKNWVKKLLEGFAAGADIVVGKYVPAQNPTTLAERVSAARFPNFEAYSQKDWESFLPSNRQIAYRKSVWQKVGKFPEKVTRSDDTVFHLTAKKFGLKYYYAKEAVVYWSARQSFSEYIQKAFQDSESDALAGILFRRTIERVQVIAFLALAALSIAGTVYNALFFLPALALLALVFLREALRIRRAGALVAIAGGFTGIMLFLAHALGSISGMAKAALKK